MNGCNQITINLYKVLNEEDLFSVKIESEDINKRKFIQNKIIINLIYSIVALIDDLKLKLKAFSYFHLRYLIKDRDNQTKVKEQLLELSKNQDKYVDYKYIKFLFNLVFDVLDSIGGGTGKQITNKYHVRLYEYNKIIFKEENEIYKNRFRDDKKKHKPQSPLTRQKATKCLSIKYNGRT